MSRIRSSRTLNSQIWGSILADDGVLIGKATAQKFDNAANKILGSEMETLQSGNVVHPRRPPRFYRTPPGGIPLPASETTPASATCTKMEWNAAGTSLQDTTVTETVLFRQQFPGNAVVEVLTIAGKNLAVGSGGSSAYPAEALCHFFENGFSTPANVIADVDLLNTNDPSTFTFSNGTLRVYGPTTSVFLFSFDCAFTVTTYPYQIQNSDDWMFPGSYTSFQVGMQGFSYRGDGADLFRKDETPDPSAETSRTSGGFSGFVTGSPGGKDLSPTVNVGRNTGFGSNGPNVFNWTVSAYFRIVRIK